MKKKNTPASKWRPYPAHTLKRIKFGRGRIFAWRTGDEHLRLIRASLNNTFPQTYGPSAANPWLQQR